MKNGFDLAFGVYLPPCYLRYFEAVIVASFSVYAILRLYGAYHPHGEFAHSARRMGLILLQGRWAGSLGIDLLAVIACFMFPRYAEVLYIVQVSWGSGLHSSL